jgi:sugar phosphate isomerase/epimerase
MQTRRTFLTTVAAAAASSLVSAQQDIKTALNGPVGLQLWSLREYLPKDLAGTLVKARALGFREVESAGLWSHTVAELRAALDAAGLRCRSAHMDLDRLTKDAPGAFAEARALGASWVVCPWIAPGDPLTREKTLKTADAFNTIAKAASGAGLRFAYHCHGYEFVRSGEGTMFDTLAGATDPAQVTFQIDVFHALLGGTDPARLIDRYKTRVSSLHLKDLKKGFPIKAGTATAPPEADVPIGSGQVDMPSVLRTAMNGGTSLYYLEDESSDPWGHIPQSVAYLKSFKPPAAGRR